MTAFMRFLVFVLLVGSLPLAACVGAPAKAEQPDPASLPAPKVMTVPRMKTAITIDGNLDEPAWTHAARLGPFAKNDGSGPERERTELLIAYDEAGLYLGWTCTDSDIQATFTNRDSTFWDEEVVECFITPKALDHYFELQWNPLGGVFDAIITNHLDERGISKSFQGDWSFTAKNMKHAVKVKGTVGNSADKDEFWQVEVMIPFADLGLPAPKPGDTWRANFYRFNRTKGLPVEELSWSPTRLPGFHQPSRFGFLKFGE